MDPLNLLGDDVLSKNSPSHGPQPTTKSDRESFDEFEHVLKDPPQNKDLTSQFINFEKGQFETEGAIKEGDGVSSSVMNLKSNLQNDGDDPLASSKNFMQYDQLTGDKKDEIEDFLKGELKGTPEPDTFDSDKSDGDDDSIVSPPPQPAKAITPEPAKSFKPETQEPIKAPTPEPAKSVTPEPVKLVTPEPTKTETPDTSKATEARAPTPEPILQRNPSPALVKPDEVMDVSTEKYESDENEDVAPPAPVPRDYPEIGVIEPRDILHACGLYTWFHPERLNPKVEALVYWRDPKQSGIVFGSVLVVLLSLTVCSLISVVAYTSLTILTAALSFRIYKTVLQAVQKTNEGHPFNTYILPALQNPLVSAIFELIQQYLDLDLTLSPERVREVTDTAVGQINNAVTELRRRFLVEDIVDSIKFGLLLYLLTYIGSWFNGLTLIILGYVALFTLPKVYENNQQQIDANLELVRAKINEVTDKVRALIPIRNKEEAKDKNE